MIALNELFTKKTLISCDSIKKCTCSIHVDNEDSYQLFALLISNELKLYYYFKNQQNDYFEKINWFEDRSRKIVAFAFAPKLTCLLAITLDVSIIIVPALSIFESKKESEFSQYDFDDVVEFKIAFNTKNAIATCCVWWQSINLNHYGIVAFNSGLVLIQNLLSSHIIKSLKVPDAVCRLKISSNDSEGLVFLLITCENNTQWKYLLENVKEVCNNCKPRSEPLCLISNNIENDDNLKTKFRNWRQSSTEKCKNILEKIIDMKFTKNPDKLDELSLISSGNSLYDVQTFDGQKYFLSMCFDKFLLIVRDFENKNQLTDVNQKDLQPRKYYQLCCCNREILKLTKSFIFCTDTQKNTCFILSRFLCESKIEERTIFKNESIIAQFSFDDTIIDIFPVDDFRCYVVTKSSVELIYISVSIHEKLVGMIYENFNNFPDVEKIADVFHLNVKKLFDDIFEKFVAENQITKALQLFNHPRCQNLCIDLLRISSIGDSNQLKCLAWQYFLSKKGVLPFTSKIQISNLILMNSMEIFFREFSKNNLSLSKAELVFILDFLITNPYYSISLVCINSIKMELWPILANLLRSKHLSIYINHILCTQKFFNGYQSNKFFNNFLFESHFLKHMLFIDTSLPFLTFFESNLNLFTGEKLLKILNILNPSNETTKPFVMKCLYRFKNNTFKVHEDEHLSYVHKLFRVYFKLMLKYGNEHEFSYQLNLLETNSSDVKLQIFKKDVFIKREVLSANNNHSVVVDSLRNVYVWGFSEFGCLGNGPQNSFNCYKPKIIEFFTNISDEIDVIAVSCGRLHTLFLTNIGIFSCGSNHYGQLGLGAVQETYYPELIENFPKSKHEIIIEISCGAYHSLSRTNFGNIYSWGWGVHGQLGHGSIEDYHWPKLVQYFVKNNLKASQISAGHSHSLVLVETGYVYVFGNNFCGQLGCGNNAMKMHTPFKLNIENIVQISTMYFHNLVLTIDNYLYYWGCNPQTLKQIGKSDIYLDNAFLNFYTPQLLEFPDFDGRILQITTGSMHSAVLTDKWKIYTWGRNIYGQIGCGHRKDVLAPLLLNLCNNDDILFKKVVCGADHTLAVDHCDNIWVWGSNCCGQLGLPLAKNQSDNINGKLFHYVHKNRSIQLTQFFGSNQNMFVEPVKLPCIKVLSEMSVRIIHDIDFHDGRDEVNGNVRVYNKIYAHNIIPEAIDEPELLEISEQLLHRHLEMYFNFYNVEQILEICLNIKNYQAASKIALLNNNYMDSFNYQLEAYSSIKQFLVDDGKKIIEFYIKIVEESKNQLLIQNVLRKSIDFWLGHQFPNDILEKIFLNSIEAFYYPLTVLLFCKDFSVESNSDSLSNSDVLLNSHIKTNEFLKQFSTKFCLTLCKLALEHKK